MATAAARPRADGRLHPLGHGIRRRLRQPALSRRHAQRRAADPLRRLHGSDRRARSRHRGPADPAIRLPPGLKPGPWRKLALWASRPRRARGRRAVPRPRHPGHGLARPAVRPRARQARADPQLDAGAARRDRQFLGDALPGRLGAASGRAISRPTPWRCPTASTTSRSTSPRRRGLPVAFWPRGLVPELQARSAAALARSICSGRRRCRRRRAIVVFTGHPRPDEAMRGALAGPVVQEILRVAAAGALGGRALAVRGSPLSSGGTG